ncbi:flagellin [Methanoculleus chikugoensis]|uniref:Flagellin n=1 Tax=Methanoculleus chikugoensis TaxID=118126 RepID=A0A1M4MK08_9EURY|nr:archaellin/type IV pilin N-terminal domain-containing protein [Methanoculleus chikugoensis]SCL75223.1 flagellin [Methanoculleus chikugoensis]
MRTLFKDDNAFTGLEAAIVLIAFIVVAAVFSYVILGAGFFTTQKSQEVVHTGVQQASSSMEVIGNVYGISTTGGENLQYIKFTIGNTAGGTALDVSKMVVTYTDPETRSPDVKYNSTGNADSLKVASGKMKKSPDLEDDSDKLGEWCILEKVNANTDTILEPGEQFIIGVSTPGTAKVNVPFTVNLQPSVGAVFALKRTAPAGIYPVNILY